MNIDLSSLLVIDPAHAHSSSLPKVAKPAASPGVGDAARHDRVAMCTRVAAIAFSLVLHVGLLMLLSNAVSPQQTRATASSDDDVMRIEWQPSTSQSRLALTPPVIAKPTAANVRPAAVVPATIAPTPSKPVQSDAISEWPATPPALVMAAPVDTTEAPAPAPTPVAATTQMLPEPLLSARGKRAQSEYLRDLMRWLARHRVYPTAARKEKIEGVVQVRFAIDRDGQLLSAAVHRSAGSALLDQAALDVLRRANPMPAFPKDMARQRLSITLPIDFSLVTN